ncbi:hypothetical protein [Stieleria varia]|uniref:Elp3/MiaA/NifB-like radical SAM core domain-containing protein n=1 Tax=Stieleria varia TaxID=2528005 RepID=A0A5C5ZK08_9BACT|nr:hypothetical protein [Stieleria varia]TWT87754.1 hypothetical protein Pla52n_70130 [Stieleria varia]
MTNSSIVRRTDLAPSRAYAVLQETEPSGAGPMATTTVFLTASECPIGCAMCDLWQNTLPHPTPRSAIPTQIDGALEGIPKTPWIKLYNSGNFFDVRSIPLADYAAIAECCSDHQRVVVENHPRIGRSHVAAFQERLNGQLEIAIGLETVQPRWLDRMKKQMSRDDFDAYASWLRSIDVDVRVFLIVGVPGQSVCESLRWSELSVRHAAACGARHVSLIPARSGHGWNGTADQLPKISAHDLAGLQARSIDRLRAQCCVTVDTWDIIENEQNTESLSAIRIQNVTQEANWDG